MLAHLSTIPFDFSQIYHFLEVPRKHHEALVHKLHKLHQQRRLKRLKRENAEQKKVIQILKSAAAFFCQDQQK